MRQNKYGNKKTVVDGLTFDSKREAMRWQQLKLMERGGLVKDVRRQVRFELVPPCGNERGVYYFADFVYTTTRDGLQVVEDTKGYRGDKVWIIKRKLMLHVHGITVVEV